MADHNAPFLVKKELDRLNDKLDRLNEKVAHIGISLDDDKKFVRKSLQQLTDSLATSFRTEPGAQPFVDEGREKLAKTIRLQRYFLTFTTLVGALFGFLYFF